jgi:hypothetical protein
VQKIVTDFQAELVVRPLTQRHKLLAHLMIQLHLQQLCVEMWPWALPSDALAAAASTLHVLSVRQLAQPLSLLSLHSLEVLQIHSSAHISPRWVQELLAVVRVLSSQHALRVFDCLEPAQLQPLFATPGLSALESVLCGAVANVDLAVDDNGNSESMAARLRELCCAFLASCLWELSAHPGGTAAALNSLARPFFEHLPDLRELTVKTYADSHQLRWRRFAAGAQSAATAAAASATLATASVPSAAPLLLCSVDSWKYTVHKNGASLAEQLRTGALTLLARRSVGAFVRRDQRLLARRVAAAAATTPAVHAAGYRRGSSPQRG